MIAKKLLEEVLQKAMSTGADFAEIYAEHTLENKIQLISSQVDGISEAVISGVGIRILKGTRCVYGSTSSFERAALLALAGRIADAMNESAEPRTIVLRERLFGDVHPIKVVPATTPKQIKIDLLKEADKAARNYHQNISQANLNFLDFDHQILVANSDGLLAEDRQIRTRMSASVIASRNGDTQTGSTNPGRRMGLEMFDIITPESIGTEAARQAMVMLDAGYIKAGTMPVAIENGFGGVVFHEACGHSLEATSVSIGQSEFCGKLGQVVAGSKVTAIDDGTIPGAWGSFNIDDEGNPSQRKVLIENGVLKQYMIDKLGGRRMGMEANGSSRRQGYMFPVTSRMSNTFIDNGPDKNEDIIKSMEYGLYCAKMGGGSVNPVTGSFNFAVAEAYVVRNGEIMEPVRGASLIGRGSEILPKIDMVGQNMATGQGMCGSLSGSIPADVGQPLLRISSITVGGR